MALHSHLLCSRVPHAGSSIQWGAWAAVGMAHGNTAVLTRVERSGMGLVRPTQGLEALGAVLSGGTSPPLAQVGGERAVGRGKHRPLIHSQKISSTLALPLLQAIASPFRFERLLHSLDPVPHIFSHVSAPPKPASGSGALVTPHVAPAAASPAEEETASAADVAAVVRARVQALLGPEVRGHVWQPLACMRHSSATQQA